MAYHVVRYVADKPVGYDGSRLEAKGSILFTRDERMQAEMMMARLLEVSTNQKSMIVTKRTRYTFRCENAIHKYLYKIVKSETRKDALESGMTL